MCVNERHWCNAQKSEIRIIHPICVYRILWSIEVSLCFYLEFKTVLLHNMSQQSDSWIIVSGNFLWLLCVYVCTCVCDWNVITLCTQSVRLWFLFLNIPSCSLFDLIDPPMWLAKLACSSTPFLPSLFLPSHFLPSLHLSSFFPWLFDPFFIHSLYCPSIFPVSQSS